MKDAEAAARPAEKAAPAAEESLVTRLHVGRLTRNVTEAHVQEIFSTFGVLKVRPAAYVKCFSVRHTNVRTAPSPHTKSYTLLARPQMLLAALLSAVQGCAVARTQVVL